MMLAELENLLANLGDEIPKEDVQKLLAELCDPEDEDGKFSRHFFVFIISIIFVLYPAFFIEFPPKDHKSIIQIDFLTFIVRILMFSFLIPGMFPYTPFIDRLTGKA
jgi:hypothetical protein